MGISHSPTDSARAAALEEAHRRWHGWTVGLMAASAVAAALFIAAGIGLVFRRRWAG